MEFRGLKKQYEYLKKTIDFQIGKVLESAEFISGPQVEELEEQLAEYAGMKYCVSCGNGTDALLLALMYWEVGEGDAVFIPDFTFFATGEVVSSLGATPIFVDVDEKTYNMDPEKLDEAIRAVKDNSGLNLKAVIAVDLFGQPADYKKINDIVKKYQLKLLEDGAQGFGGGIHHFDCPNNTRYACSFGEISTTSFFPAKPLGCYGDGGAIFTNDSDCASYLKSMRVHGKGENKYDNVRLGMNSRLDTIQAAILLPKLEALKQYELEQISKFAQIYTKELDEVVKTPCVLEGHFSSWAQYTIQLSDRVKRDELQSALLKSGIPSMIYYQTAMHHQKAFTHVPVFQQCHVTEKLCNTVLSLPIHPYLEMKELDSVIKNVKKFVLQRI